MRPNRVQLFNFLKGQPMELALTIIAGLGLLLLIISYLGYVRAGFKYNVVTGLISALPVLNIVTLPALWNKAGKKFLIGFLGLIILASSWFFGANKGTENLIAKFKGQPANNNISQTITSNTGTTIIKPATIPSASNASQGQISSSTGSNNASSSAPIDSAAAPFSNTRQRIIDESAMASLPAKPLYIMTFETIPVNQLTRLKDRIVKIKSNGSLYEGRVLSVNNGSVTIQAGVEQELAIANIQELQLMVKKAKP